MKSRYIYSLLIIFGIFLTVLLAAQNIDAQSSTTLTAFRTTATITLDGEDSEAVWNDAEALTITNVENSGVDVSLKAISDGSYLYIFAHWDDDTMSNTQRGWSFNGTNWSNVGGDQDRIAIVWSVGGSTIVCGHSPGGGDTMLFDVWHWKAAQTAGGDWADDKYWDGSGRHSDARTAGGYLSNSVVAQAENAAAITSALGNSSPVSAFSNDDRPYWDNEGSVISWSAGVNSTPIGDFINGYKTEIPTGSRGDVMAASDYDHGDWHVEFKRALDTGHDDDIAFEEDTPVSFYLALFDDTEDEGHFRAGGSSPTVFSLDIPSLTPTTPTTPPDNLLLYTGIAGIGIVIIVVVVVLLKRR